MTPQTGEQKVAADKVPDRAPEAEKERSRLAALGKQALLAYWRDLAQLLQERPRQWVAYHGDRQLGFAATRYELWQECVRQGLHPDEFLIRPIEPEDPELVLEDSDVPGSPGIE